MTERMIPNDRYTGTIIWSRKFHVNSVPPKYTFLHHVPNSIEEGFIMDHSLIIKRELGHAS